MSWQTVEHWRRTTNHGVWHLELKQQQDMWAHAWRVEWWQAGHLHTGRSFTGDSREADARAFTAAKLDEFAGQWERAS